MGVRRMFAAVAVVACAVAAAGCRTPRIPKVPGHTEISVSKVEIEPRPGEVLTVNFEPLYENLGLRVQGPIFPERTFNPFRLAEDRRRLVAYLQGQGRFDAEADEPELKYTDDHQHVAVTWHVHEGAQYKISTLDIVGAPPELLPTLRAMVPFGPGSPINLEIYRPIRRDLAERLQDEGFGHARGYSRTFVDRETKTVAWWFYLDPGPKTRISTIAVEGNHSVPVATILARTGLTPGKGYSTSAKRRAELALLDTGAFASAIVLSDADIQTGPPEHPDTGGILAPEQVDGDGKLVPRVLPDEVAVRVIVVEAPRRQLRAEAGLEADPTRVDAYAGTRILLRNLFAPQHHLVLEGDVGYGWRVGDDRDPALGVYGSATAQYLHPGFLTRDLDLRVTARWRDTLYPSELLREYVFGPGVRSTVAPGVFVDFDAFYRIGHQLGLPALDGASSVQLQLPMSDDSKGVELTASVVADRRDDKVEALRGWLLALRSSYSPGGPLGDHRWLQLAGDARSFHPLNAAWSVALRASGGVDLLPGDDGVPLGARLFGGGAFGFRGYGRDHLSPVACALPASAGCDRVYVGGRSLFEASAELRWLPFRKQYGLAAFGDVGASDAGVDPFEHGIAAAVGVGGRVRLWYLPVALDIAYRFLDDNEPSPGGFDRLLFLFRVGEAF